MDEELPSPISVFVYGTLRNGGSNHFRMDGAIFVMAAHVRGRLYGIDWYPGLILDEAGDKVIGEVYTVTPEILRQLDVFEGSSYRRTIAELCQTSAVQSLQAAWLWEWLGPVDEFQRISNGDWFTQKVRTSE